MISLLKIPRRVNTHLPAPSAIFPLGPKDVYNGKNISYHIYWILTYLFSSDLIFPFFWSVPSWSLWLSLDISSSLEMQNHFIYIENKTEIKTPAKTETIIMTHFVSRSNTFFVLCSRLCANLFFSDVRPSMSSNLPRTSKVFWQKPQDATRFLQYYCLELEEKVELVWVPESMLNKTCGYENKSYLALFCFAIFTTVSYPGHIQYRWRRHAGRVWKYFN